MSYRPVTLISTGPTGFNPGNGIISQDFGDLFTPLIAAEFPDREATIFFNNAGGDLQRWAKEWALGCVNSPPAAGGNYRRRDLRNLGHTLLPSPVH